jgi:hypothetical protein
MSEECLICRNKLTENIVKFDCNCQNLYHFDCIDQWLISNKTCPTCRRELGDYDCCNSPNNIFTNESIDLFDDLFYKISPPSKLNYFANEIQHYNVIMKDKLVSSLDLKSNIAEIVIFDIINQNLSIIPDKERTLDKYIIPFNLTLDIDTSRYIYPYLLDNDDNLNHPPPDYWRTNVNYLSQLTDINEYRVKPEVGTLLIYNLILNRNFYNYYRNTLLQHCQLFFDSQFIFIDRQGTQLVYLYPIKLSVEYDDVIYQGLCLILERKRFKLKNSN